MDVGFIGLGNMGSAMAHCLLNAGQRATAYNRTRARADKLAALGKNTVSISTISVALSEGLALEHARTHRDYGAGPAFGRPDGAARDPDGYVVFRSYL